MASVALLTQRPVAVEVEAADREEGARVREAVIVRLLEADYALVAAGTDAALWLRDGEDAWTVEARAGDRDASSVVEHGPFEAVRLELVHQSIELLRDVDDGLPRETTAVFVAIEVREAEAAAVSRADVADTLATAGLAVLGPQANAPWRVCIASSAEGARFATARGDDGCEEAFVVVAAADDLSPDDLRVALAREAERILAHGEPQPRPTPRKTEPARPPPMQVRAKADATAERPRPRWSVRLGGGAGVATRIDQAEAAIATGLGATHRSGAGVELRGTLLPSRAGDLSVLDTFVTVGPSFDRPVGRLGRLGASVTGGVQIHRFELGDEPAGHRADMTGELALRGSLRVVRGLHVGLELVGGISNRPRAHNLDGAPIWARDRGRVLITGGLTYVWGLGS